VCVSAAPPLRAGALMHAQTFLKFFRLFLSSLEELISEFRRCLSSVYHMIYLTIHAKEAWTSLSYRERSSPFDFYATILLMIMSKLWEPFLIGGGLYEKQYTGKTSPACLSNKTDNCNCGVLIWFLFYWMRYLYK
jgi:hypothetical protein